MSEAIQGMWRDVQPYEDYGLAKYVEWTPNPNQQFGVRRFNFRFRRA